MNNVQGKNGKDYNEAEEIIATIRAVCEDRPELKFVYERYILSNRGEKLEE